MSEAKATAFKGSLVVVLRPCTPLGRVWAGSAGHADVQDAELGPAGGARHPAAQPGLGPLLVLPTGEPLAHAGQAPHGAAVALLALALALALSLSRAQAQQLDVGHLLHAADTGLQLLGT